MMRYAHTCSLVPAGGTPRVMVSELLNYQSDCNIKKYAFIHCMNMGYHCGGDNLPRPDSEFAESPQQKFLRTVCF